MKATVTYNDFYNAFMSIRPDNFSRDGLFALYEYFTDLEEALDLEIELDVIEMCCDYTEYSTMEDVAEDYPDITTIEQLQYHTQVIEFDTGLIIQAF